MVYQRGMSNTIVFLNSVTLVYHWQPCNNLLMLTVRKKYYEIIDKLGFLKIAYSGPNTVIA
jgi:hypothetical protein